MAETMIKTRKGLGHRFGLGLEKNPKKTDRNGAPHSGAAF